MAGALKKRAFRVIVLRQLRGSIERRFSAPPELWVALRL